jgi:hypothetical protein
MTPCRLVYKANVSVVSGISFNHEYKGGKFLTTWYPSTTHDIVVQKIMILTITVVIT